MARTRTAFRTDAFTSSAPVLKRLGQNFLVDERFCQRIVEELGIDKETAVVEIGPGRGALTRPLFEKAGRVTTVEIDRQLAADLQTAFAGTSLRPIHDDALRVDLRALCDGEYKRHYFVANLPYYIATSLVVKAIAAQCFAKVAFMIQRELAERFVAVPGTKAYGAVTVLLQATCRVAIMFHVPRTAFAPVPDVESCFVLLEPLAGVNVDVNALAVFVRACFASRRKNIKNNLAAFTSGERARSLLQTAGIPATERPERVDPATFLVLFRLHQRNEAA